MALVITILTLFMGARNLNAGLGNFLSANSFASSTAKFEVQIIWLAIVVALSILNIIAGLRNRLTETKGK